MSKTVPSRKSKLNQSTDSFLKLQISNYHLIYFQFGLHTIDSACKIISMKLLVSFVQFFNPNLSIESSDFVISLLNDIA